MDLRNCVGQMFGHLGGHSEEPGAASDGVLIQYFIHYFADTWGAATVGGHRHEGDWEVLQILFDADGVPYRVSASQQLSQAHDLMAPGGASIDWTAVERVQVTHPVAYVGSGGHSLYD